MKKPSKATQAAIGLELLGAGTIGLGLLSSNPQIVGVGNVLIGMGIVEQMSARALKESHHKKLQQVF
jgi:hypothetical protein